jgi:hypothetical protein
MEINYNMILKYLVKDPSKEKIFVHQKNFMTYSDKFPVEFKNILGDKFYRIGVTQNINKKNISFYTCLITLLDDNMMSITEKEELNKINDLLSIINNKITKLPPQLKDISKGEIKKYLKDLESNIWIYELIANYLKINFIIFDFNTLELFTIYYGDFMDPWRTCLFLAKSENTWEPIRNNEKKFFCYNDNVLKKILTQTNINLNYLDNKIIKKDLVIVDNLKELLGDLNHSETNIKLNITSDNIELDVTSDNIDEIPFIKNEIKLSESKLNKMTKPDLIIHLKSLNIKSSIKSTKKDLVQLILQS